ncbi:MAG: hypothetical protein PUI85_05325 [Eubacteriales bacterium]|nr:hypothetical protein [Eubacteriales bacterium]MDY3332521.1 hypothetical protein [Gallibacter sp.]
MDNQIKSGKPYLKVVGIIMIVFAVITGVVNVIALPSLLSLAAFIGAGGMVYLAIVLTFVIIILQLVAGIYGVQYCAKPEKADFCMKFGIAIIVLIIVNNIVGLSIGLDFKPLTMALGLILPALYIYGATLNKKLQ